MGRRETRKRQARNTDRKYSETERKEREKKQQGVLGVESEREEGQAGQSVPLLSLWFSLSFPCSLFFLYVARRMRRGQYLLEA